MLENIPMLKYYKSKMLNINQATSKTLLEHKYKYIDGKPLDSVLIEFHYYSSQWMKMS